MATETGRYGPTQEQIAEEQWLTNTAVRNLLRRAGFFPWGHDSWCHDAPGIGVVTTAEALDILGGDDEVMQILEQTGSRMS